MPKGGLEPPRVASHGPQPCASTSSATSASGTDIPVCRSWQRASLKSKNNESDTSKNACPTLATFAFWRLLPVMLRQPGTAQPELVQASAALTEPAKQPALMKVPRIAGLI